MINITLRQLRYFKALARHKHFGRAAAASNISQPALSMQIRELEETLGVALVERGMRSASLTGIGETLLARVDEIIRLVDDLEDLARMSKEQLTGRLRLGVIPTIAPYLLPRIMERLAREYPGLDIVVRESQTVTLINELAENQLDIAILALPIAEPAFEEVELFSENFVLLRSLKDAHKPIPDPQDLPGMPLLLLEEGHCFRDQALSYCTIPQGSSRP